MFGTLFKSATKAPEDNPFTFVLSSDALDRDGDIIVPQGIQLANFKKNPIALFQHNNSQPIGIWENIRVEGNRLLAELKLAKQGTSYLIDTLRSMIEQGILRAVSIGFMPITYEEIDTGYRLKKIELTEASIVTVPSNQTALRVKAAGLVPQDLQETIFAEDKGHHSCARDVLGKPALQPRNDQRANQSTQKSSTSVKEKSPMNIADKLREKQARLLAIKNSLTALATADNGDLTDDQTAEIDTLSAEQSTTEKSIETLNKLEQSLAGKAVPALGVGKPHAVAAVKELPGSLLFKTMAAAIVGKMSDRPFSEMLKSMYADDERVAAASKVYLGGQKSVTAEANTYTAGWAQELVRTDIQGFLDALAPFAVYPALRSLSMPLDFGTNHSITIPQRNYAGQAGGTQIGGSWVGEGGVIPVKQMALSSQTLNRFKLAVISAFTNELMSQSVPNIETLIRNAVLEDTAMVIDGALLDAIATVAGVRPSGLRSGAGAGTPSSGNTSDNIITDLKVLLTAMSAINGSKPVLILNTNRLLGLATVTNAVGTFMFRDEIANGNLLGVPFIASTTVPANIVLMVDSRSFVAANAAPEFAVTDQATLVMASATAVAPTMAGVAADGTGGAIGTAEQVVRGGGIAIGGDTTGNPSGASVAGYQAQSMFQQYQTAIRMVLPTSWGLIRTGAVAYLTGVNW